MPFYIQMWDLSPDVYFDALLRQDGLYELGVITPQKSQTTKLG